ncbi:septum formation family protein [Streptomyces sp. AK02-04a]|uniref:septum formation family protein n=1 Tax=Streptomyces sp. AK02-04a TaxID=3028649 RepID=UPI0029BA8360|nr:septum formation family protein [Streptomyces sp. AK02-04a]MDX3763421.1 septum formation family protein [Streptomyces sp. AK02-04a]
MRKYPVLLGAAGLVLLTGCTAAGSAPAAVPTVMQVVGTCHTFRTPQEMVQPSDVTPPVPCGLPHRSETFEVTSFDGQLAAHRERPDPEQLQTYALDHCDSHTLRRYVGAGPRDTVSFSVWPRYPTRAEWAEGVRTLRCDAVPPVQEATNGPLVAFSLRDVLKGPESSVVRNCEYGDAAVTCDHPHDREEVNAWLDLDNRVRLKDVQSAAATVCKPYVEEFLRVKLARAQALTIKAETPSKDEWAKGVRTVKCGVGPADPGVAVVGTLSQRAKGRA